MKSTRTRAKNDVIGSRRSQPIILSDFLPQFYQGRVCKYASRSPDLNPLNFFFWWYMKSLVYETPVDSAGDLVARIVVAADKINRTPGIFERVRQSFHCRCELCNDTSDRHFEHFL
ncbi:hypothetical protein AVEN_48900-1 [Araneus ventricosus]|uniref:Uncharacterized protein n=1 Tax=Araneus ventricosus TaxID=182803 RepID=A0A4Y2AGK2_ARAVE|nr:hypothetical protein AVEN_48900-1 [Araneus ventricosus]